MLVSAAPHFASAGIDSVIVGQGEDHPYADELIAAGYRVRTIPRIKSIKGLRAWVRILKAEEPNAIHIHPEGAFALSVLAARYAAPDARVVRTIHSFFLAEGWWAIKRRAQAMASDRYVDEFVALGEEMVRHEASFGRECVVIPNWVDDRFLEVVQEPRKDVDLVIVGNCAPVKRHGVALSAALENGWTVAHLGHEGEIEAQEKDQLAALAGAGLLRQRGVDDPLPWLRRSRVYAMPSAREGFSVALAEAISLGCVCVISHAPGLSWALRYPLVSSTDSDWGTALRSSLDLARALGTPVVANVQRDRARAHLAAGINVEHYVQLYRGSPKVRPAPPQPPSHPREAARE